MKTLYITNMFPYPPHSGQNIRALSILRYFAQKGPVTLLSKFKEPVATKNIEAMKQRMSALMTKENLAYGNRSHTYNSRLAQELAKWGESLQEGEALNLKLFEAYFAEGRNLAEPLVLLEIAETAGLDRDAAEEMISKRSFRDAVDADWKRARELGVTGVPTFVFGNQGLVGAQPYEALEQLIRTIA